MASGRYRKIFVWFRKPSALIVMSCPSKHLGTIFISASEKSLLGWEFKGQSNTSFYSLSTKKLYNAGYVGLIEDISICFKILLILKYFP